MNQFKMRICYGEYIFVAYFTDLILILLNFYFSPPKKGEYLFGKIICFEHVKLQLTENGQIIFFWLI